MPSHDFKQLTDYASGFIILHNTATENDPSQLQMKNTSPSDSLVPQTSHMNHFKKIHFLPTRRGAQLKLFHNVNFFRTDKHFQLAVQFMKDVDIRYITFQWQYYTDHGWETFTTDQKSATGSASAGSPVSSPHSSQGQKPFVLIHKLNIEKNWLKMEVQFPLGSVALKGKKFKWKPLEGGKMFRVVMTSYLGVEGTAYYEKQSVLIPYVIDNKRSKENEKIDKIHVNFKPSEHNSRLNSTDSTSTSDSLSTDCSLVVDEHNSHHADKILFDTHAELVNLKDLSFLKVIFPPHLVMSNHVLTEVISRSSSRDTSPMSSVSSPGASTPMETDTPIHNRSSHQYTSDQSPSVQAFSANSNQPNHQTMQQSNQLQQQIQFQAFQEQMQNQLRYQQQMQQQFQQERMRSQKQQHRGNFMENLNFEQNVEAKEKQTSTEENAFRTEDPSNAQDDEMDLSFIDEFEHHNYNKINQSMFSFQNIPQLSDVPEMPQRKRKRTNSNDFFSNGFSFDEVIEDKLERAILDFAPLNTHSSVSLLGNFKDLTLSNPEELKVYFGREMGTILNVTSACISVLTPIYNQPDEVTISLQKDQQIIPNRISFRFVQDFNTAASQLATKNQTGSSNNSEFSSSKYHKQIPSKKYYYNDGKHLNDDSAFGHAQNHWANSINPLGQTVLHVFSEKGLPDYVATCLRIGVYPTCRDNMGRTPLHLAAARGHIMTSKLLLKCAGLNLLTWRDYFDETPLDIALRYRQYDFIDFLFKWVHVSFLPSMVFHIKSRFSYVFKICYKAKHMKNIAPLPSGEESNPGVARDTKMYISQIDEQAKLISELRKRLSCLKVENNSLKADTEEQRGKFKQKSRQKTGASNTSSFTSQSMMENAGLLVESPVLSCLKSKTLQQQAEYVSEKLQNQISENRELKRKLIFSQMRNRQFELEYSQLSKNYNDAMHQIAVLQTRKRKNSLLNVMVSHADNNDFFSGNSLPSASERLKKVNENAWKQFTATLENTETLSSHHVLEEPHFFASEHPIFHKLLTSRRNNEQSTKDTKSLRLTASQFENLDIIKEAIFGASPSGEDRDCQAHIVLSPFASHREYNRSLVSDTSDKRGLDYIHTGIVINNCLMEWEQDSLCSLRHITEQQKSCFSIRSADSIRVPGSKHDALAQLVVTWNRTKEYDPCERNCQHFVDSVIDFLVCEEDNQLSSEQDHHLTQYLNDIRSDASMSIPHTYISSRNEQVRINFYNQKDLDEYMQERAHDISFEEVQLLHSFDRFFHFLQESTGSKAIPTKQQQKSSQVSSPSTGKRQQSLSGNMKLSTSSHEHVCPLDLFRQTQGEPSLKEESSGSAAILYREQFPHVELVG